MSSIAPNTALVNDPAKAGTRATQPEWYGPRLESDNGHRFSIFAEHTTGDQVAWVFLDHVALDVGRYATEAEAHAEVAKALHALLPAGSPDFLAMDAKALNDYHEQEVGYRPHDDEPGLSVEDVRANCIDIALGWDD
jgi:hypothetical protein